MIRTKSVFLILILMIGLISCQKKTIENKVRNNVLSEVKIDNLTLSDDELGFGCITEYYRKGEKMHDEIYVQTSSKDDKAWINYISINGKKEIFYSNNEDPKMAVDEEGYTLRLENEYYIVEIEAKISEANIQSDSALALGILTITRKSDQAKTTINFEGGTAC